MTEPEYKDNMMFKSIQGTTYGQGHEGTQAI